TSGVPRASGGWPRSISTRSPPRSPLNSRRGLTSTCRRLPRCCRRCRPACAMRLACTSRDIGPLRSGACSESRPARWPSGSFGHAGACTRCSARRRRPTTTAPIDPGRSVAEEAQSEASPEVTTRRTRQAERRQVLVRPRVVGESIDAEKEVKPLVKDRVRLREPAHLIVVGVPELPRADVVQLEAAEEVELQPGTDRVLNLGAEVERPGDRHGFGQHSVLHEGPVFPAQEPAESREAEREPPPRAPLPGGSLPGHAHLAATRDQPPNAEDPSWGQVLQRVRGGLARQLHWIVLQQRLLPSELV